MHGLRAGRFEMHLDAGVGGVPDGAVGEAGKIEVCAELAVEAGEDVAVEGGGDSGGIVVGGEQSGDGLPRAGGEVDAEQESVAGVELGAEAGEDSAGLRGGEVADAGADVEGENAGVGRALNADGVGDVVGDARVDGDAGDAALDGGAGLVEGGGADVDGLVEDVRLPPQRARTARRGPRLEAGEGAEEDAGFGGGAGTELGDGDGGVAGCRLQVVS